MAYMNFRGSSAPVSPPLYQLFSDSSHSSGSRSPSIASWASDPTDSVKPDDPTKNEEEEEEEVVYLAMGKDQVKDWQTNLSWVLKNVPKSKKIAVLHVHRPSKTFNMMGAMVSAENLNDGALAVYQQMEAEKMNKTKKSLLTVLYKMKIKAELLVTESDDIVKGLVSLISQHRVTELVMGAAADKYYSKKLKAPTSKKALAVNEQANPSCKIWFISSGNLICIREPRQITSSVPNINAPQMSVDRATMSIQSQRMAPPTPLFSPVGATSTSSAASPYNGVQDDDVPYPRGKWSQEESELDEIKRERDEVLQDLCRSDKHRDALEVEIVKLRHLVEEFQEKLGEAHSFILQLEKDNDKLQQERVCAVKEANLLRKKVQDLESSRYENQKFCEFTYEELKEATNGFADSLKIGEGGYGSVYKGLLHGSTVAIKILNPWGMQGKEEFFKEMSVLSKLRHPNLVTLIGACPETWALVYEFLPNGSLEDRLSCKGDAPPLTWQARTRIAAEVCSALIFLHSTDEPVSLIHGDLKPSNILLDSNFVSRLGDFGFPQVSAGFSR
ncbi:U-box domain-containing protein 33-like isoform X2 [Carex rostrata]